MSRAGHGAPEFVLASASPRRSDILQAIGIQATVQAASIDERPVDGETPARLVERLARTKATTVAGRKAGAGPGDHLVVGADTVIDLDGEILGKPVDRPDAERMLLALSGRDHDVITGVAVVGRIADRAIEASTVERTGVTMRSLSAEDVAWYLGTGEFDGKAGAYAIQGLGALLVDGIRGDYLNVVGLSVTALDDLLRGCGRPLREFVSS